MGSCGSSAYKGGYNFGGYSYVKSAPAKPVQVAPNPWKKAIASKCDDRDDSGQSATETVSSLFKKFKAAKTEWKNAKKNKCDDRDDDGQSAAHTLESLLKKFKAAKSEWKKAKQDQKDDHDDDAQTSGGCGGSSKITKTDDDAGASCSGWKTSPWKKAWWSKHCDKDDTPVEEVNNAPTITSPTAPTITVVNTALGAQIATVVAEDLDGDTLEFSIVSANGDESADADMFLIDPVTGQLTIAEALTPFASADGDATYEIEVAVTDGQATDTIELDILLFTAG